MSYFASAQRSFSALSAFPKPEDYKWCHTDRAGKKPEFLPNDKISKQPRTDFFLSSEERDYTRHFFDFLRLPLPCEENVYRGTSQDLLFLDKYGLVIRNGPLDVIDLAHPGVLQPLFWIPDEETNHVIALYPGVRLLAQTDMGETEIEFQKNKLASFLDFSRHKTLDIHITENVGLVGERPVIIDAENLYFGCEKELDKKDKHEAYSMYIEAGMRPDIAIAQVMKEFYGHLPEYQQWHGVYDYHQPLRTQIREAFKSPLQDIRQGRLASFYARCERLVQQPEGYIAHEWESYGRNGMRVWSKKPSDIQEVALYKPWTGYPEDNAPKSRPSYRVS